jgi:hypothetical protein
VKYLIVVIILLVSLYSKSQDSLILLNGKQYFGTTLDTAGLKINFNIYRPGKKAKLKSFYRDQVFSIKGEGGKEHVFYYPDMYFVDEYTVDNMRFEVYGRMDGRNGYKTKWVYPVGLTAGLLTGYFSKGAFLAVLVPIVYIGVVQIPIVKIQPETISNPDFIGNEYYAGGYDRSARMKRTTHAIISGFAGLAAGMLLYEVTK